MRAGVAHAAPRAPTDDHAASGAVGEAAKQRFGEGVKHYAKKRYDRALAAFLQAYALTKNPAILFNLGITSVKLGNPLNAVHFFEQFLRDASTATPEQRARAESAIARARESLGSVEIIAPDGADIAIDGEPIGRAPLAAPVAVQPGDHAITITTAAGAKLANVDVKSGMVSRIKLAGGTTAPASAVSGPAPHSDVAPTAHEPALPAAPPAPGLFAPPDSIVPVYAAGVVGIGALSAAIVLGGVRANADRNTSVALDALGRNSKDATACTGAEGGALAITCSSLRSAVRSSASVNGPFAATLAIGAAGTVFALGWYMFAPKTAPRVGANGLILNF